jgi:hypothetical protein
MTKAVDLLSGLGGPASFLRTRQLGARLAGPSLPLDLGFSKAIPPGIRQGPSVSSPMHSVINRCRRGVR